jgi:hypothetical protein
MGEIAIGDLFKHKKYGFTGKLICVDHFSNIHVIQSADNREPKYYSDELYEGIEYPPTLTWKGLEYQMEEDFEKI